MASEKPTPGPVSSGLALGVLGAPVVFVMGGKILGWIAALLGG